MIYVLRSKLEAVRRNRPEGYIEDIYAAAVSVNKRRVRLNRRDWNRIQWRYGRRGIGDVIHDFLAPFVRGTRLANCSGCKRRQSTLNRLTALTLRKLGAITHRD